MALIFRKHEGATFKVHAYPERDQEILRKPREIPPRREGKGPGLMSGDGRDARAEMNPRLHVVFLATIIFCAGKTLPSLRSGRF